jgi:uncharacterized protein
VGASLDPVALALVVLGAFVAGFTSGFAGFGTALVSSGIWFLALPATMVPPLITLASVVAQAVSLLTVRRSFNWSRAAPFLGGGVLGVPLGVTALKAASPLLLKTSVGVFLLVYVAYQLLQGCRHQIGEWGGKAADGLVGLGGGFLGGFAGLSGPLPLVWLQLRGGRSEAQRAVYQPFNLVVLALAGVGMAISGQMTTGVLWVAAYCFPATLVGAWLGARVYFGVSPQTFQRVVLGLLFLSGLILIWQAIARVGH